MLAEQMQTAVQRPLQIQDRVRTVRRTFTPTEVSGSYKLPRAVHDRLTAILAPVRNREAVYALALFLGRYWSAPARIVSAFPVDRRALAERAANLDLTEGQIRGALRTLEAIGFLIRTEIAPGSRYRPTDEGLHRKPVLWRFGAEFVSGFLMANKRAQRGQGRRSSARREIVPSILPRPLAVPLRPIPLSCPKSIISEGEILMGKKKIAVEQMRIPLQSESHSKLEAALDALKQAVMNKQI